nr:MADS-box transcription factor 9 [Brachypodium distachyon]
MDKLTLQIQKNLPENSERDTAILLHQAMAGRLEGGLEGLPPEKYASVRWMVQTRLRSIGECIAKLQGQMAGLHLRSLPVPVPAPLPYQQEFASQKEIGSVNEVIRSDGGDVGTLVFTAGDGAGANTSAGGGFSWQWCADLGGPSSSMPPM